MRRAATMLLAVVAGTAAVPVGSAQNSWGGTSAQQQQHSLDPNNRPEPPDPGKVRMEEQQAKRQNDDRQRKLVSDTAKIYELAEQLRDQVGKTDKNTLSVDVVKKAEEIEHLAKSVKERMRGQN